MFGKKTNSGYWIHEAHVFRADVFRCSVCGAEYKKMSKTCAKCGSRMKKLRYDPQWVDELEMLYAMLDD